MRVTQMSTRTKGVGTKPSFPLVAEGEKRSDEIRVEKSIRKFLSGFEKDDYILAGLLIVLILEGCDDYVLLAVIGYLFIMGFKTKGA